jgi:metal-responsive CopG/Arc/MetJ family transcriptional regulator
MQDQALVAITVKVPSDLVEFIDAQARANYRTRSSMVRVLISQFRAAERHNGNDDVETKPALSH